MASSRPTIWRTQIFSAPARIVLAPNEKYDTQTTQKSYPRGVRFYVYHTRAFSQPGKKALGFVACCVFVADATMNDVPRAMQITFAVDFPDAKASTSYNAGY